MSRWLLLWVALPLLATGPVPLDPDKQPRALARRFIEEGWIQGKPQVLYELCASTYKVFDPRGRLNNEETAETQMRLAHQWCVENGDCSKSEVRWVQSEGDRVTIAWTLRQSPRRPVAGLIARLFGRVPLERPMLQSFRFANGKVVELTNARDDLGVYFDLGLINLVLVAIFALGGALGMLIFWLLRKGTRRPA